MKIIEHIKRTLCKEELEEIEKERQKSKAKTEYIRFLLEQILEVLEDDY